MILIFLLLAFTCNSQTIRVEQGDTLICITTLQMDKVNIAFMELHSCEKELKAMTDAYLDYKNLCSLQDSLNQAVNKQFNDCQSITLGLQFENQKLINKYNLEKEEFKRKRRRWFRNAILIGVGSFIIGLITSVVI